MGGREQVHVEEEKAGLYIEREQRRNVAETVTEPEMCTWEAARAPDHFLASAKPCTGSQLTLRLWCPSMKYSDSFYSSPLIPTPLFFLKLLYVGSFSFT